MALLTRQGQEALLYGATGQPQWVSIVDPFRGTRRVRNRKAVHTRFGLIHIPWFGTRVEKVYLTPSDTPTAWMWQERSKRVHIAWTRGENFTAYVSTPLTGADFERVIFPGEWLVFWDKENEGVPLMFIAPDVPAWGDEVPDPDSIRFETGSIVISVS